MLGITSGTSPRNVQVQACTRDDLGLCVYMREGEEDRLLSGVEARDLCTDQLTGDGDAQTGAGRRFWNERRRIKGAGTYDNILGDLAQQVWRGWFEEPYGEWVPVLFADEGCKRAVLLKRQGVVLSTMLLSSPLFPAGMAIVSNALNLSKIPEQQLSIFRKQFLFGSRYMGTAILSGAIVAAVVGYALGPDRLIQALLTGVGSGFTAYVLQRLAPRLLGSRRSATGVEEADTRDKTGLV